MPDKITVYAISENGDGRVIEMHSTTWEEEDEFDLPPLQTGWIYRVAREKVE